MAAGKTDRNQPAVPPHEPRQSGEERPTNVFDTDVETFVTRERFHTLSHVLVRIIDDLISTVLADNGRLGSGAHGCKASRTEQRRELNASQSNPAGGSRYEDRFTSLQPCPLDQGIPS